MDEKKTLRHEILELVRRYHAAGSSPAFRPGEDTVRYAGRFYDEQELVSLVDSSLDFWLTAGRYSEEFEAGLGDYLGVPNVLLVNSGSSANLVAFSTLTSPKLKDRQVRPGDEVITVAAGFPTTVNPIIQNRAVPVFVDVDPLTGNIDPFLVEQAASDLMEGGSAAARGAQRGLQGREHGPVRGAARLRD